MLPSEWNFEAAARHLKTKVILPDPLKLWGGASLDSRTLKSGQVFFALRGKNQDGHEYLQEAFRRGASGAVIRDDYYRKEREAFFRERALFRNLVPVPDPEEALAVLSSHYRNLFSLVSVAVTGSVAKTGTKEFIRFLLAQKYPILASPGNLNNHLGLPLTLFRLEPEHRYCVAELGASQKGEIRKLCSWLKPKVGVITGVSPAHLESFGSLDGVYDAKLELAASLAANRGTLVLPDRDPELTRRARQKNVQILFFGKDPSSDFRLTKVQVEGGWVEFEVNDQWAFRFPGNAAFQAENALAALTACFACGISPGELPPVWKDLVFPKGRFEILSFEDGITLVNDCYNANPYSFEKALEAFSALEGSGRKILVLGDMLELGVESAFHHRRLGERIREKNFQALLSLGEGMRGTTAVCDREGNPPLVLHFEDRGILIHFLSSFLKAGDSVLFKASRSMKLEEVIERLTFSLQGV